ncbi:MAG: NifU family protein [Zetaproteobacteria bacterium]|nr:NifU family protein [Zetaproteobacteria bacterium]OIO11125.1 MAG: hypothetical protein AUJ53_05465 [Flavobacteriaceae bacterium CG1_02_35_72]PJA07131.1 MAG: hypothetical protein COX71_00005 [Flavobacteriales bacterium CG_4_10_14_0_2_um_filter_35_18]
MFKIVTTPNQNILKFESQNSLTSGSFEFTTESDDASSELVSQLLQLPFLTKVFISSNFIALQKIDLIDWVDVQDELKIVLEDYFKANKSLFKVQTKTPVEVYAESTPNPETMKFVINKLILKGDFDFNSKLSAEKYPFIAGIFDFEAVKSAFVEQNYIAISKGSEADWQLLIPKIRSYIKEHFEAFTIENQIVEAKIDTPKVLEGISQEIVAILDEYIKPAVMADGGNIIFDSYNALDKTVKVILKGACNGCPSSTVTLKNGIEATLKNLLPNKINQVIAI